MRELFGAAERIVDKVLDWPTTRVLSPRFGGRDLLAQQTVFGHLNGDGTVDVLLPTKLRNDLVLAGVAEPHPRLVSTGWVTVRLSNEESERRAIQILRRAYDTARERSRSLRNSSSL